MPQLPPQFTLTIEEVKAVSQLKVDPRMSPLLPMTSRLGSGPDQPKARALALAPAPRGAPHLQDPPCKKNEKKKNEGKNRVVGWGALHLEWAQGTAVA